MALSNTPILGFNRWTERCTFSASSEETGFEAENLGTLPLGVPWQSENDDDQYIDGEFDGSLYVGAFLLSRPDLSDGASFRLRLYEEPIASRGTPLYDSASDTALVAGQRFWPIVLEDDQIEWEGEDWFEGSYTDEQKRDTVFHRPIVLNEKYLIRSWRLDLSDPTSTLGFMRLGHIEVCQGWQLSRACALGQSSDFEVRTTTVTPYGGSDVHNRLSKKRTFMGDLRFLPKNEVNGVLYEMMRQYDLDLPFMFVSDPTDPSSWLRESFLAKFARLTPTQRAAFAYSSNTLNLKEAF